MFRQIRFAMLVLLVGSVGIGTSLAGEKTASEKTSAVPSNALYEMRIYDTHPDKLDALLARFRDHTCGLFTKHGMTNVAYFVPVGSDSQLIYFMAYPDQSARDASWKAFMNDPEWKTAFAKSRADGPLVKKVTNQFFKTTDYSPTLQLESSDPPRLFELRTYTASPNNLPALNARFRDHTVTLFDKHGLENIVYFNLNTGQDDADKMLVYLLAHKDVATRNANFKAFAADSAWKSARANSEAAAGGSLTAKGGVKNLFLVPTDFSPIQ